MEPTSARRQALIALALMSLIWSFNWIVMKRALHYIGPLDFSALRTVLGTALLFLLLAWRRETLAPTPLRDTILIGLAQTGAFQLLVQMSLVEGGAGKMALLAYTMPFWVVAFAWALLGERPTRRHWICLTIAAAGLLLVIEPWRALGSLRAAAQREQAADEAPVPARDRDAAAPDGVAIAGRRNRGRRGGSDRARAADRVVRRVDRRAGLQRHTGIRDRVGVVAVRRRTPAGLDRGNRESGPEG